MLDAILATQGILQICVLVILLCLMGIAFIRIPQIVAGTRWAILNMGANRPSTTTPPAPAPEAVPARRAHEEIVLYRGLQIPQDYERVEIIRIERKNK